ncbi:MAG: 16S rRNA (cytosine(1402)-N(4))-methyltransferase [Gammaproteobacteria bacterium CG22_combo_CG10-13_8_21_14_all_40_8]|nr:MAG: 16S rRNA (cytosine(1402)-N(4))-methyltransferase [Gammaproteobacteria bacterium CG22_combo_CG10-13_8_21_14_all_40_8]
MTVELHQTVLLETAVKGLDIKADGIYIDATFGRGGHSQLILSKLNEDGRLIAIDRDPEAVAFARQEYAQEKRFEIVHSSFSDIKAIVESKNLLNGIDGILLDLGVSSPQLDDAGRGFSFMKDGELDMRMDTSTGLSAKEWLASEKEDKIADVLWKYGEERFSRQIAKAIVEQREKKPLETTKELASLIESVLHRREKNKHPATRSFQGIRIYINDELGEVEKVLQSSIACLKSGGRLSVISFHSLEDRIVKRFIRDQSKGKPVPREIPITEEFSGALKGIGKAMKPDDNEVKHNVRARSAVLRVAEKK